VQERDAIVTWLRAKPLLSYADIAERSGVSINTVRGMARANGFCPQGRGG
jgi:transposase